uniref:Uncharacterized protein n=1 Tax=Arundo donax TaxID=35708 RepID=A0A0A9ABS3_ARUDO
MSTVAYRCPPRA